VGGSGRRGGSVVDVDVVVVGAAVTGVVVGGVVVVGVVVVAAVVGVVMVETIGAVVGTVVAGTAGGATIGRSGIEPVVGPGSAVGDASVAGTSGTASAPGPLGPPRRDAGSFEVPEVSPALAGGPTEDPDSAEGSGGAVRSVAETDAVVAVPGERTADFGAAMVVVVVTTEVTGRSGADRPDSGPRHTATSVNKVRSSPATTHRPTVFVDSRRPGRRLPSAAG
jgi:hypothetical protein